MFPPSNASTATELTARGAIIDRIENERGFVREWPRLLAKWDPEFTLKLHEVVQHALHAPGEIPLKYREMILMAINAADEASRGFRLHMQRALAHGASPKEIVEVLRLVGVIHLHGLTSMLPEFERVLAEQHGGGDR